jgi:shikimate dehydrogenase
MTDRYAVMGNPVAHSKSPRIHAEFARATGQDLVYDAQLVELDQFAPAIAAFFGNGGKGLNITVPFKQEAWALAQDKSEQAALAGAVNTLFMRDGRLQGHNTDGIGLVRDIKQNHNGSLTNKRVLILGAGGATRGILLPFLQEKPTSICIANRTVGKADELARIFAPHGKVAACGYDALPGQQFDWVINATAASLQGDLPPLPADLLAPGAWCYDLMYAKEPTVFCRWANQHGATQSLDGLGMLAEQAAEAFWLWRGVMPQTAAVLQMLR